MAGNPAIMNGYDISERGHHRTGHATALNSGGLVDIVDPSPSPTDNVERLLDMPEGEEVSDQQAAVLRRFYEVIEGDLQVDTARKARTFVIRILGLGHRIGALKSLTVAQLGEACGVSRQALCQAANVASELLGTEFAKERPGPNDPIASAKKSKLTRARKRASAFLALGPPSQTAQQGQSTS